MLERLTEELLMEARGVGQTLGEVVGLPWLRGRWRGQAGQVGGLGAGSSIDFHDQREYGVGDDPRHINWQAYARTGSYTLKLYREEVRPELAVVVDSSLSMLAYEAKARRVAELVYFLAASGGKVGANVRYFFVGQERYVMMGAAEVESGLWVEGFAEAGQGSAGAPDLESLPLPAQSMRVLVSDLLFADEPESLLRPFGRGVALGMVWVPYAMEEAEPGWSGNYRFDDVESGESVAMHLSAEALERYRGVYNGHMGSWQEASVRHQLGFKRVGSEQDLGVELGDLEHLG